MQPSMIHTLALGLDRTIGCQTTKNALPSNSVPRNEANHVVRCGPFEKGGVALSHRIVHRKLMLSVQTLPQPVIQRGPVLCRRVSCPVPATPKERWR